MKKTWIFYTTDIEGRNCIFNVRECIKPHLTKDWRELQLHLEKSHIDSIGYTLEENNSLI